MFITNDIKYIGVNDHRIDLFEGQYAVPNGMAYNSYVILDEKIAVCDTVLPQALKVGIRFALPLFALARRMLRRQPRGSEAFHALRLRIKISVCTHFAVAGVGDPATENTPAFKRKSKRLCPKKSLYKVLCQAFFQESLPSETSRKKP